jgi:hypothetical protein
MSWLKPRPTKIIENSNAMAAFRGLRAKGHAATKISFYQTDSEDLGSRSAKNFVPGRLWSALEGEKSPPHEVVEVLSRRILRCCLAERGSERGGEFRFFARENCAEIED